jgi:hypothetical protein
MDRASINGSGGPLSCDAARRRAASGAAHKQRNACLLGRQRCRTRLLLTSGLRNTGEHALLGPPSLTDYRYRFLVLDRLVVQDF